MMNVAIAVVVSFIVTFVSMVALRPLAFHFGLVDRPGGRKAHIGDVPVIGGVAMFVGVVVGLMLVTEHYSNTAYLLAASGMLVGVGLLDDRYSLSTRTRLLAQVIATLLMIFGADVVISDLGNLFGYGDVTLGWLDVPLTVVIAVAVINAFNLVDGVDGLAGSLAVVSLAATAVVGVKSDSLITVVSVSLAVILSFLIFNFPTLANRRLRSFMGDSGSTFLGLMVVWMTTMISQGENRMISPVIGLWFAAIPIFDLFTCFVRRALRGKSPFTPGRDHFHHQLKRSGMGVRKVLFTLTLLQAAYALIGLIGHFAGVPESLMFTAWSALGLFQYRIIRRYAVSYRFANWGNRLIRSYV